MICHRSLNALTLFSVKDTLKARDSRGSHAEIQNPSQAEITIHDAGRPPCTQQYSFRYYSLQLHTRQGVGTPPHSRIAMASYR